MIVLDTQALVWWVSEPEKLSKKVQAAIKSEIKSGGQLLVSSISVWEIYLLVKKNRLSFATDVDIWIEKVESLPFTRFVPVDNRVAAKSVNLPGEFHNDPADRMIVALARENGATLVSSDLKIRKYPHVQSLW